MAATKLAFLTQPSGTIQGWTLFGAQNSNTNIVGYTPTSNQNGILVAVLDANNVLQQADTSSVTIAFGTNPTSGSVLLGTLTRPVKSGYATFDDLAITLGGNGYTLTATDGGLSSATSPAFNITNVSRVNPSKLVGTTSATGLANAFGPYRFRGSRSIDSVRVSFYSTNATDVAQIVFTEPGLALSANTAQVPKAANYSGSITAPASITIDGGEIGGGVDIYVYTTTQTGTPVIVIERTQENTAP